MYAVLAICVRFHVKIIPAIAHISNALISIVFYGSLYAMVNGNVLGAQMNLKWIAQKQHVLECFGAGIPAFVYQRKVFVIKTMIVLTEMMNNSVMIISCIVQ